MFTACCAAVHLISRLASGGEQWLSVKSVFSLPSQPIKCIYRFQSLNLSLTGLIRDLKGFNVGFGYNKNYATESQPKPIFTRIFRLQHKKPLQWLCFVSGLVLRVLTVLLDTLLNCVGVKHRSCIAPRREHCFNKAEVKGGFPLGPHMLKIYACSWYYQALWMKAPIKWHVFEDDCTLKHFSTVKNAAFCSVTCVLLLVFLRVTGQS